MTPADRDALIARAKVKAVPLASCVAASIRPDHLFADVKPEDLTDLLMALVVVLAEAAHPVRLREVVQAGDDGLAAQGITPGPYLSGHQHAAQVAEYAALRGNGMEVAAAAERMGIGVRTAGRYEAALVAAGKATWQSYRRRSAAGEDQQQGEAA